MHSSLLRMKRKNEHIAYVPAALVLTTLPHSRVDSGEYVRRNGHHLLTITAPAIVGIPYGVILVKLIYLQRVDKIVDIHKKCALTISIKINSCASTLIAIRISLSLTLFHKTKSH